MYKASDIAFTVVFVTPEMARDWLAASDAAAEVDPSLKQRNLRPSWVLKLGHDHANGGHLLTHQAIAVGPSGFVYDGQHRLNMLARATDGAWMCVARYSSEAQARLAMGVLDSGIKRDLGDRLVFLGLADDGRDAAAIVRIIITLETGDWNVSDGMVIGQMPRFRHHIDSIRRVLAKKIGHYTYPAFIVAPFAFARECGVPVDDLCERLATRVGMTRTESVLAGLVDTGIPGHSGGGDVRLSVALKVLRLIEAVAEGEDISKAEAQNRKILVPRVKGWTKKRRRTIRLADVA